MSPEERAYHQRRGRLPAPPTAALAAAGPLDNPDMTWLWTHCRAIGMTKKSDSGLMKDDIGLFTATQKDMIDGLALLAKPQPKAAELSDERGAGVIDPTTGRTADMHARVRSVLKHHQLTKHGDGVIEADLIEAVLASIRAGSAA